ncbi:hypothetical protein M3610_03515 [Neobacillus sp. MER 74]|uniref:hypothetical protein n=1 Tax=Bacillaceae TaxID=186817 RepID=UPI000BF9F68C|nr:MULTISPECIES: hypothetical protein [Bacillaceae]MCM3114363.1 hypothetical protein [Neobacillus sp. MER 74]PFP30385.1 hypothetical protein COJ96_06645 [Bacillus sp. AFS073361]
MKIAAIIFFIFSAILLLGAIKYLIELTRPGVYPPKQILRKKVAALCGGGGIFLLIAVLISKLI